MDVYGAYVGPMLTHVRLLEAMLGPSWNHVAMLSLTSYVKPKTRCSFQALTRPERSTLLSGPCQAYMIVYVRLLETMLALYLSHVEPSLPGPMERVIFGSCRDQVGRMDVYVLVRIWCYIGLMLIHVRLLEAMLGPLDMRLWLAGLEIHIT